MKVQIIFAWYDFWIGIFYDKKKNWIYIFPFPTIGIIIKLPKKPDESKLITDFYMWMVENDYNHNIRIRVEKKAELFLKHRLDNKARA